MVHELLLKRGFVLGRERKDAYVRALQTIFPLKEAHEKHIVH